MKNYTLGINAYHADSSAALLIDGEVVSATEEERFTRQKHWAGLPIKSIEFCLKSHGLKMSDISSICVGRDPKAKILNKIKYMVKNIKPSIFMLKQRFANRSDLNSLKDNIKKHFGFCPTINFIEHHRAHLASAFFSSPFEEATLISIDGSGDFSTIMIGKGVGNKIEVIESQDFPISIGLFYTAFTQFLGFPYYGDEYKVMGLSPYGSPDYLKEMRSIIWSGDKNILEWNSSFFNLNSGAVSYSDNNPNVSRLFDETNFKKFFGDKRLKNEEINQRHKNIASSLQKRTEELIFEIIERAFKHTKISNLCIAGGVAQNSVANGKILNNTSIKEIYIPSAGHDAGISMGASQYHYFHNLDNKRTEPLFDANLGIYFSNEKIKEIIEGLGLSYKYLGDDTLFKYVAKAISNNNVIGFFDGKAEFGPRALGSRSILADPRNSKAQQLLNEKIKKRESFRPFAPSIIEDYGEEFFENYQYTPFMERVIPIKKEKQKLIPAVTHVDGSGRLQSVKKELRPRYYNLINEFYKITGIPILINTSFNENEPVVNIPEEAIDCYLRTDMDMLVLGNYILEK
tara:strand:- start:2537 stop:4252 length:1716 start_codon:yes stop_codon:yes gene_type:complete